MGAVITEFLLKYKEIAESYVEKEMPEWWGQFNKNYVFENPCSREVSKNIDDSHVEKSPGDEESLLHTLMIHGLPDDWMEQV